MLKKFTVSNYRSFEKPIAIDFANVRDYDFNEDCIKNGLINKSVIYGENAVGKTNFGRAIMDVVTMVSIMPISFSENSGFQNAKVNKEVATFEYIFQINGYEIEYTYEKYSILKIRFESLKINQQLLYELNFDSQEGDFSTFSDYEELKFLNLGNWNPEISVLKYILSHTKLEKLMVLKKLQSFIDGMFNSWRYDELIESDIERIIEENLIHDFENFLREASIDIRLKAVRGLDGKKELYIDYGNNNLLLFLEHASSGTLALVELYMLLNNSSLTFAYIDEFDSHLHFAVSKLMLEKFKQKTQSQTVITTHNTDLMSNKYMRPDCYLVMTPDKITNLADTTARKLRMGHHLENLYQAGGFELVNHIGDKDE